MIIFINNNKNNNNKMEFRIIVSTIDAIDAGSINSRNCTLHIHDNVYIPMELSDKSHIGFLRIDPDLWETIETLSNQEITDHRDVINIKSMVGLRLNIDYSIPTNYEQLRYGKIVLRCNNEFIKNKFVCNLTIF